MLATLNQKEQSKVKRSLKAMMYADNREEALIERKEFESDFRHNPKAVKSVVGNWEWLVAPNKPVCLSRSLQLDDGSEFYAEFNNGATGEPSASLSTHLKAPNLAVPSNDLTETSLRSSTNSRNALDGQYPKSTAHLVGASL